MPSTTLKLETSTTHRNRPYIGEYSSHISHEGGVNGSRFEDEYREQTQDTNNPMKHTIPSRISRFIASGEQEICFREDYTGQTLRVFRQIMGVRGVHFLLCNKSCRSLVIDHIYFIKLWTDLSKKMADPREIRPLSPDCSLGE